MELGKDTAGDCDLAAALKFVRKVGSSILKLDRFSMSDQQLACATLRLLRALDVDVDSRNVRRGLFLRESGRVSE